MNSQKLVVTGGAGFIGSHMAERLVELGNDVHVVDDLSFGDLSRVPIGVTFHLVDVRDGLALEQIFHKADVVFHLAAISSVSLSLDDPVRVHSVNSLGTVSVLEAARRSGVRRLVYSSSSAAYGKQAVVALREDLPAAPRSPYGLSKYEGELSASLFSNAFRLETVSLRYFNVYGPRQNHTGPYAAVIARFLAAKKSGRPLQVVGDGEQTRDFIMVDDVVSANLAAATSRRAGRGEVINIGTGNSTRVIDLARMFGHDIEFAPRRREIRDSRADTSRALHLLDFAARLSLEEGLKRTGL